MTDTEWSAHIKTIIEVQRRVLTRGTATGLWNRSTEIAFYVANALLGATRAAEAVRLHWGIENTSHDSRDVTFGEDLSRIRTNPGVFAACAVSPSTSSRPTRQAPSARIAIAGVENLLTFIAVPQH